MADRQEVLAHVDAALLAGPRRPKLDDDGKEIPLLIGGKVVGLEMTGSNQWEWAMQYVTDHGYGKATQPVAVSGEIHLAPALKAARERAANR